MSTDTRDAKKWLENALDGVNSRARAVNEQTVVLRVGLNELNEHSHQAVRQAIMVARGFGLSDVAASLEHLAGVLPGGPFVEQPSAAPHEDDDIIDAEFEVCHDEK
jgi:hypothetical protein